MRVTLLPIGCAYWLPPLRPEVCQKRRQKETNSTTGRVAGLADYELIIFGAHSIFCLPPIESLGGQSIRRSRQAAAPSATSEIVRGRVRCWEEKKFKLTFGRLVDLSCGAPAPELSFSLVMAALFGFLLGVFIAGAFVCSAPHPRRRRWRQEATHRVARGRRLVRGGGSRWAAT